MARLLPEALQVSWRTGSRAGGGGPARRGQRVREAVLALPRAGSASYVSGILADADRAEDVTQEVFISALRRLRDTERPIAFKPWIYQIAKNACIDELRRTQAQPRGSARTGSAMDRTASDDLVSRDPGSRRRRREQAAARGPARRVPWRVGASPPDPRPPRARGSFLQRDRRRGSGCRARSSRARCSAPGAGSPRSTRS